MDPSGLADTPPPDCAPLLKRLVAESHALLLYENAAFLAERLLALEWDIEAAYWVAQSYFLQGDFPRVYHFLKPLHPFTATFPPSKDFGPWYWKLLQVWGVSCVKLHRYQHAEQVFAQQLAQSLYVPTAAELSAHHYHAGVVCRRLQNKGGAAQHFTESCALNPFLFSAFEEACTVGQAARMTPTTTFAGPGSGPVTPEGAAASSSSSSAFDDEDPSADDDGAMMVVEGPDPTKAAMALTWAASQPLSKKPTPAPRRAPRHLLGAGHRGGCFGSPRSAGTSPASRGRTAGRGLASITAALGTAPSAPGVAYLLQLLARFGEAFRLLCLYKCPECLEAIQQIPAAQAKTGWALGLLGRAHLELADYGEAAAVFARLRRAEPHRLEGMVEYSTALYQLKRDKELAALGQALVDLDRFAAPTLAVLANCFSFAGDHDAALRFLRRAIKQCPFMWYAHTLLGHEHFVLDDIDEALQQYRQAMLINPLHFNAWYGMGQVYMKQEQFTQAQHYFSVAIKLNPNCSPLYVHLALTLQCQEKYREALENLQAAIAIQPANLLARLKRAQLNLGLGKTTEALQELEFLWDKAPREAQIGIALGKCYHRQGLRPQALQCYNLAMDLDPKETPNVKRLMDQCLSGMEDSP
jgi:tetratricopeptide (TPR) repeat protein